MKKYTAIDLFSGCGGLSLGLEQAGFNVLASIEIDPLAVATYQKNHSGVAVIQNDIKNVDGQYLEQVANVSNGRLDLLAGCPPCQGFSRIKTRNRINITDKRNDLIFEFVRMIKELRPKMVLLENVPGLAKDWRFRAVLKVLDKLGYKYDWAVLNAADFGVPQRRKRLIMMASRLGSVKVPSGKNFRKTVGDCIRNLENPERSTDVLQRMHLKNTPRIKKMIAKIPVNGGSRASLGGNAQLSCHKKIKGFRDVYGRMKWDDVAPTLTGGCFNPSKGRFLHPTQHRPITLREAALLQTFPRKYLFPSEAGLTAVAKLIGDALPPVFGKAQGQHLKLHIEERRRKGESGILFRP